MSRGENRMVPPSRQPDGQRESLCQLPRYEENPDDSRNTLLVFAWRPPPRDQPRL